MATPGDPAVPAHSPAALRERREGARLSQRDVAQRAGCSQSFLSQLETGQRSPSLDLLLNLARTLGCSVTDLIPRQREGS